MKAWEGVCSLVDTFLTQCFAALTETLPIFNKKITTMQVEGKANLPLEHAWSFISLSRVSLFNVEEPHQVKPPKSSWASQGLLGLSLASGFEIGIINLLKREICSPNIPSPQVWQVEYLQLQAVLAHQALSRWEKVPAAFYLLLGFFMFNNLNPGENREAVVSTRNFSSTFKKILEVVSGN